MKMGKIIFIIILFFSAGGALAQQQYGNPIGQILGQAGGGQLGLPLLLKPQGTSGAIALNVTFSIQKDHTMVGVCHLMAQIQNASNVYVNLGSMPLSYINQYDQMVPTILEVNEVAPGQIKQLMMVAGDGLGQCGTVTGVVVHGGGGTQWPNSCLIQNSPVRPCPVSINASGQNVSVQYR